MKRLVLLSLFLSLPALAELPSIQGWAFSREIDREEVGQTQYLLGLGPLQKLDGMWRPKQAEIVDGELTRVTWQVREGFTSEAGYSWWLKQLPGHAEELFACQGLECGSSVQWANMVFENRLLYGHEERQRYSAWRWEDDAGTWYAVLYAVDRANRRHYLHLDLLKASGETP